MNTSTYDAENPTPEQVYVARHYLWSCVAMAGWTEQRGAAIEALPDHEVIERTLRLWPEGWADFCITFATDIANATENIAADKRAHTITSRNGTDLVWKVEPSQMLRLFQHATEADTPEPYYREVRTLALHLIFDSPRPPASASELLEVCTAEGLARLWGGEYDPGKPWNGTPGVEHEIAMTLGGKQPVLPFLRVQLSNLLRTWTADPTVAIAAAAEAGITVRWFVVNQDLLRAVRGGAIAHASAGRARFGRRASLDASQFGGDNR